MRLDRGHLDSVHRDVRRHAAAMTDMSQRTVESVRCLYRSTARIEFDAGVGLIGLCRADLVRKGVHERDDRALILEEQAVVALDTVVVVEERLHSIAFESSN